MIVIANARYHRATPDMLVVAMTSNPSPVPYSFILTSADPVSGRLSRPGTVRVDRVYTLAQSLAARTLGRVDGATLDGIGALLHELIAR